MFIVKYWLCLGKYKLFLFYIFTMSVTIMLTFNFETSIYDFNYKSLSKFDVQNPMNIRRVISI